MSRVMATLDASSRALTGYWSNAPRSRKIARALGEVGAIAMQFVAVANVSAPSLSLSRNSTMGHHAAQRMGQKAEVLNNSPA